MAGEHLRAPGSGFCCSALGGSRASGMRSEVPARLSARHRLPVRRHVFHSLPSQWCLSTSGFLLWLWHFPLSTQVNDWQEDWVTFYTRQRIQPQMDMVEKGSGDREALELWSALQVRGVSPCKPDRHGPEAGGATGQEVG